MLKLKKCETLTLPGFGKAYLGYLCYKILLTDWLDPLYKSHLESFKFKIYLWFVGWAGYYAYDPMHNEGVI